MKRILLILFVIVTIIDRSLAADIFNCSSLQNIDATSTSTFNFQNNIDCTNFDFTTIGNSITIFRGIIGFKFR